jgi:hypothetical protein
MIRVGLEAMAVRKSGNPMLSRFSKAWQVPEKDPYAQCPVMNSFGSLVAAFTVKSRI